MNYIKRLHTELGAVEDELDQFIHPMPDVF